MAAIESTATTGFTSGNSVTITKPTGLAVGDLMIAKISGLGDVTAPTLTTPAGWTIGASTAVTSGDAIRTTIFYNFADSSDVAASNFTFTSSGADFLGGQMLRVSGIRTDITIDDFDSGNATNTAVPAMSISYTPLQTNVLYLVVLLSSSPGAGATTPSINANNPTWVSQFGQTISTAPLDNDNSVYMFSAIVSDATSLTTLSSTQGNASASTDWVSLIIGFGVQVSANGTVAFTTSTQTAFTPAGQAGASGTTTFSSSTQSAFTPTGKGTSPTQWNNDIKSISTWTNQDK